MRLAHHFKFKEHGKNGKDCMVGKDLDTGREVLLDLDDFQRMFDEAAKQKRKLHATVCEANAELKREQGIPKSARRTPTGQQIGA